MGNTLPLTSLYYTPVYFTAKEGFLCAYRSGPEKTVDPCSPHQGTDRSFGASPGTGNRMCGRSSTDRRDPGGGEWLDGRSLGGAYPGASRAGSRVTQRAEGRFGAGNWCAAQLPQIGRREVSGQSGVLRPNLQPAYKVCMTFLRGENTIIHSVACPTSAKALQEPVCVNSLFRLLHETSDAYITN